MTDKEKADKVTKILNGEFKYCNICENWHWKHLYCPTTYGSGYIVIQEYYE